jgi:hypothetical protein
MASRGWLRNSLQFLYIVAVGFTALLALAGYWVPAVVLLCISVPLIWWLGSRGAEGGRQSDEERAWFAQALRAEQELRMRPTRYEIPPGVEASLSTASLQDVPANVRTRPNPPLADQVTKLALQKSGTLSPLTHVAVVYRLCFAPLMKTAEEALFIRFGHINTGTGPATGMIDGGKYEEAWVLVTTRSVKWHLVADYVPGMPLQTPPDQAPTGNREIFFGPTTSSSNASPLLGSSGTLVRGVTLQQVQGDAVQRCVILFGEDPSSIPVLAEIRTRTSGSP